MKKNKKKIATILELILGGIVLCLFVACIVSEVTMPDTDFAKWIKENVWDVEGTIAGLKSHIPTLIHCLIYIVVILAISKILRICFRKNMTKSNRAKTVITLLDGIVKYACAIALIILILKACGVNTTALIASVGVLTLVIGLGAQSLIADIIAGMFIIFENEYNVGEIVSIGDFRGTVIEIGIRSTKLLDTAGNIKIINNSDIKNVVNMSRELSLASVDCEFPYDVPLEFVEKLFKENLEDIKAKCPGIIEGPYYKGVSGYGDNNVAVRLVAKCNEEDRYQVQRDMLREYRQLFIENGFDLSFQQVVLNQPTPSNIKTDSKTRKEAQNFVKQQKEESQGLDNQNNV